MKVVRFATDALAIKSFVLIELDLFTAKFIETVVISSYDRELEDYLKSKNIRYHPLALNRDISLVSDLSSWMAVLKIIRKEKPDVVHTITPKAGLLGMTASRVLGIRKRVHDYVGMVQESKQGWKRSLLNLTDKITCSSATDVFVNSFSLREKLVGSGIVKPSKVKVINKGSSYGVDLSRFNGDNLNKEKFQQVKTSLSYDPDAQYLLYAGRIVKDKGIEELISVFNTLSTQYPLLRLIIIGKYEQHLNAISEKTLNVINTHPKIIHISWTNNIEYYMSLATALIHPSHREGFPNVLLEAGAMKCPVICSDATGNIDIIKNKETGLLFNIGDQSQMIEQIIYAISNKPKIYCFAENLYRVIATNFSHVDIIRMNLHKYD
jgi:glycosyltransferase involved in cell wall biosynthesis